MLCKEMVLKLSFFLKADVYTHYSTIKQEISKWEFPLSAAVSTFSKDNIQVHLDHMVTWYCALWFLEKVYFHDETVIYFIWYLEHRMWSFKKVISTEPLCAFLLGSGSPFSPGFLIAISHFSRLLFLNKLEGKRDVASTVKSSFALGGQKMRNWVIPLSLEFLLMNLHFSLFYNTPWL